MAELFRNLSKHQPMVKVTPSSATEISIEKKRDLADQDRTHNQFLAQQERQRRQEQEERERQEAERQQEEAERQRILRNQTTIEAKRKEREDKFKSLSEKPYKFSSGGKKTKRCRSKRSSRKRNRKH